MRPLRFPPTLLDVLAGLGDDERHGGHLALSNGDRRNRGSRRGRLGLFGNSQNPKDAVAQLLEDLARLWARVDHIEAVLFCQAIELKNVCQR